MEYVVDLTVFGEMLESMGDLVEEDASDPGDMPLWGENAELGVVENTKQLRSITGISKVKVIDEEYKSVVSFKFKDLEALNKALNILMADTTGATHVFFDLNGGVLSRRHNAKTEMNSSFLPDDMNTDENSGAEVLQSMKYKISMQGPSLAKGEKIEGVDITNISKNKVLVETNFQTISENPEALNLMFNVDD